jgi:hypothetical protein
VALACCGARLTPLADTEIASFEPRPAFQISGGDNEHSRRHRVIHLSSLGFADIGDPSVHFEPSIQACIRTSGPVSESGFAGRRCGYYGQACRSIEGKTRLAKIVRIKIEMKATYSPPRYAT